MSTFAYTLRVSIDFEYKNIEVTCEPEEGEPEDAPYLSGIGSTLTDALRDLSRNIDNALEEI